MVITIWFFSAYFWRINVFITLSTVLIRCVDGSGTAEGRGNLRFGQPYRTAAVVVHFNAAFLLSFVDNS